MTDPTNKDIAEALRSITDLPLGASLILRLAADRLDPPMTTDDGWIKWDGGEKPDLPDHTNVVVRFRDGSIEKGISYVGYWHSDNPEANNWLHNPTDENTGAEIVAYRVVK